MARLKTNMNSSSKDAEQQDLTDIRNNFVLLLLFLLFTLDFWKMIYIYAITY